MQRVAVAGYGLTKFRKNNDSLYTLACESARDLFRNSKNLVQEDVETVLVSTCDNAQYTSSIISEMLGLKPKISHRIENMCNSGGNAIISAYSFIASGLCDVALVVGVEKADSPAARLEWDISRGSFKHPAHWAAMFAKSHMNAYGTTEEQMAMVSVKNHDNALMNPTAYFQNKITLDDVLYSKPVVEPVKLYDCSAPCDGAASLLLVSEERAREFSDQPVWITGIGQRTVSASLSKVSDLTRMESTILAARDAYAAAKIGPDVVDVAEVHDAFTICEILSYEDLGFVKKGEGGMFAQESQSRIDGKIAVNPRGGLIGTGHPIGATGVAQAVEIVTQLRNEAGRRQVKDCKIGLTHNLSAAATSTTIITMGA
ncbi:MAG TPA: beta-ketoacyl synthase N-terminal-like domain-containing protein [Nitrososphaerales archaeon]|nr:beta-ketoacyl synthase N-terminal-like domain-containing protein [Nitrososphaerales archaeon]